MNKKALKTEILKCGTDPVYFIRNYVKIEHPIRGLILFELYDYQEDLVKNFIENRFNIVNKARQMGISEINAAFSLWLMLFRRNKNVISIATKREVAAKIIRKVKIAYTHLPKWLKITDILVDNVNSLEFRNHSRIKAISTTKDSGRSEAGSLVLVDEAAHIETMKDIWTGMKPVISTGGSVSIFSTPLGVGNMYHKLYTQGVKGENNFVATELMWWLNPEHCTNLRDDKTKPGGKTSDWFEFETAGMSYREIAQEYCCSFLASGDTFIPTEYIEYIEQKTTMKPIRYDGFDRNIYVWNDPTPQTQYLVVADVARGDGEDYSTAQVLTADRLQQVAEYKGKPPPDEFAQILVRLAGKYNKAVLVVENNSIGLACIEHIKLLEYENLYFSAKGDLVGGQTFDTSLPMVSLNKFIPGFTTSHKNRPLILQKLEEYIRTGSVVIRSERLLEELRRFVWRNNKAEAAKGYNDDLVMAMAIACWIKDTFLIQNTMSENISKDLLSTISKYETTNVQVPGATSNPDFARENEKHWRKQNDDPYKIKSSTGHHLDIGWLIDSK